VSRDLLLALWALAAGAGIPLAAALNGTLASQIGGARQASVVLFIVALACALLLLLGSARGVPAASLRAPPHHYLGGFFVAFYIFSVTSIVPRFGVANTILFIMLAQLLVASLIDHTGLLGQARRPINVARVGGLVLVALGLCVTQMASAKAQQQPPRRIPATLGRLQSASLSDYARPVPRESRVANRSASYSTALVGRSRRP
jgi:transporter family-2 protein